MANAITRGWYTLSHLGVTPTLDKRVAQKIVLANQMSFTVSVVVFIASSIGIFWFNVQGLALLNFFTFPLYLLVPLLNYFHRYNCGRFLLTFLPPILIIMGASFSDTEIITNERVALLSVISAPIFLFGIDEKLKMIVGLAWIFICMIFMDFFVSLMPFPKLPMPPALPNLIINSLISLIILVTAYLYLQTLHLRSEKSLESALTLSKQQAIELEVKNEYLKQLNQDKNDFLGIAAHDLKNPLSGILGLAEIMQSSAEELSPQEILEYSTMIKESSEKMFQIIINLLDVNAIETGKMSITMEKVDVLPILNSLIKSYTNHLKNKQLALHFQPTELNYVAMVDKNIVQQILDNLLSNAIKYSPLGKNIYVRIQYLENKRLQIEIQDEGQGLSNADQEKLFGKFTRLSTKPTAGEHSTGLGLFIVKKLVTAMNGSVWCKSELNQGATFIVTFPSAQGEIL